MRTVVTQERVEHAGEVVGTLLGYPVVVNDALRTEPLVFKTFAGPMYMTDEIMRSLLTPKEYSRMVARWRRRVLRSRGGQGPKPRARRRSKRFL